MNKYLLTLLLCILGTFLSATAHAKGIVETLDSENKIYVVVLVLATIFAGIILYLVYLDRKISKLEKEKNHN